MKKFLAITAIACMLLITGCNTHIHIVGAGPRTGKVVSKRQWYAAWGLVRIRDIVSAEKLARGARNYKIRTRFTAADVAISIFTSLVSINCRTVEVTK